MPINNKYISYLINEVLSVEYEEVEYNTKDNSNNNFVSSSGNEIT